MKTSIKGINFIKNVEGCRLTAYLCSAGKPTIGYGHTGLVEAKPIITGVTKITQSTADALLLKDITVFENSILKLVKVPLTQGQFDALVSFCFNLGSETLQTSTLLKFLNQKKYNEVPAQILRFNKATVNRKLVEIAGLTRRRKGETDLWLGK